MEIRTTVKGRFIEKKTTTTTLRPYAFFFLKNKSIYRYKKIVKYSNLIIDYLNFVVVISWNEQIH